ncbi:hypothetical protein PYCCODRAFT_1340936, partial [Trametes coccinea BRFM310]
HMMKYLESLRELFDHQFVPNHHLSMHLMECLLLFGPVHAWWAFPFERFNGLLQRMNTNSKADEMSLTFMRYFYLGSNIKLLMAETEWPDLPPFRAMQAAYADAIRDAARGTRLMDIRSFGDEHTKSDQAQSASFIYDERKLTNLPDDIYQALLRRVETIDGAIFASAHAGVDDRRPRLPHAAQHVPSFDDRGVVYATHKSSRNNSFVLLASENDSEGFPVAAQIEDIILHGRTVNGKAIIQPFFIVHEYVPLSPKDASCDPYREYEDLQTRLFYSRQNAKPRIVTLEEIRCHFASLKYTPKDIDQECIIVRSLDR